MKDDVHVIKDLDQLKTKYKKPQALAKSRMFSMQNRCCCWSNKKRESSLDILLYCCKFTCAFKRGKTVR